MKKKAKKKKTSIIKEKTPNWTINKPKKAKKKKGVKY